MNPPNDIKGKNITDNDMLKVAEINKIDLKIANKIVEDCHKLLKEKATFLK